MNKPRSLQFSIITFFAVSTIITFLTLGAYVIYDYHKELSTNLENSLTIMAEDVVRHKLYNSEPEVIKNSFHFLEEYHESPFVALFDHLTFAVYDEKPVDSEVCSVIR